MNHPTPHTSTARSRRCLFRSLRRSATVAFLFALGCTPPLHAQLSGGRDGKATDNGSIAGSLVPASNAKSPLTGVTVTIDETGDRATVDKNGEYKFDGVKPGTYTLVASGEGFSRLRITDVVVQPDHTLTLGAETMPVIVKDGELQVMEEVVVTAKKDLETMDRYVVNDIKPQPYQDLNVDIPRGVDDVQPYYIFNSDAIEESGALNVEDFLKQRLTMDTSYQTNSQGYSGNYANGNFNALGGGPSGNLSNINLNGLGSNETLILVDGHREAGVTIAGTNSGSQPDINGIPIDAIDRIEVLPSSASGIYGGSAMGGVINIVLKKTYNGGEIDYTYENVASGNAPIHTLDATYGFTLEGGKTRVMITAQYSDSKPLLEEERIGIEERGIDTILKNDPAFLFSTSNYQPFFGATPNIIGLDSNYNIVNLVLNNGTSLNSPITYIPAGTTPSTSVATLDAGLLSNAGSYNLNPSPGTGGGLQDELGSGTTTKSIIATVRRQISSRLEAFAELSFEENKSISNLDNVGTYGFDVTPGTLGDPFSNAHVLITVPNDLHYPANTDSITRNLSVGLIAKLPFDWNGELDYTWSQNTYSWLEYNNSAYGAVERRGPLSVTGNVDLFTDTVFSPSVNSALASYSAPFSYGSSSTVNDLALRASGPIAHLSSGDPILSLEVEHRKEGYPDNAYNVISNYSSTYNSIMEYFGQSQTDDSVYTELNVPLVTAKHGLLGLKDLELQLSNRFDYYTVGDESLSEYSYPNMVPPSMGYSPHLPNGDPLPYSKSHYLDSTRTAGIKYQPVDDIIIRASFAQAFVPPSFAQLAPNPVVQQQGDYISDPAHPSAGQYYVNTVGGGNPALVPEHDKDWNCGLVYEPKGGALKGFRVDLEFHEITQLDYITTLTGDQILSDPALASRVVRDMSTGLVTQIDESYVNANQYKTDGWDLAVDYRKATAWGTFGVHAMGSMIEHEKRQLTAGQPLLDYIGYPDDGGEAKTKANATLSWAYGHWNLGWTTTWFDGYKLTGTPGDPLNYDGTPGSQFSNYETGPGAPSTAQGGFTVPSQMYHELVAKYAFGKRTEKGDGRWNSNLGGKLLSNVSIQVGIKNLFNSAPPLDVLAAPYYYSYYGDIRLRDYYISIRKAF